MHSISALLLFVAAILCAEAFGGGAPDQRDLTGKWRIVVLHSTWSVEFTPTSQKKLDRQLVHCDEGIREQKDKHGKDVTQEICLWRKHKEGRLQASIGGINCQAPFNDNSQMLGECRISPNGPAVAFTATRMK